MSVLETPRIYFKGQVAWDPITTNNYNTNYDEDTGDTIYPSVVNRVKAFREQAIAQVGTAGNWNPDGTHRATFFDSAVCGFDNGAGTSTADPFVNSAANFMGMLVDLEPFGAFSSQLFFDSMTFGVDGGYRIFAPRTSRFTARYINFTRNPANAMIAGVASVVWQTSFAKAEGLQVDPFDSPVLQSLASALQNEDVLGLSVRFNAYRTIYYDDANLKNGSPAAAAAAQELIAKLNEGGFQPNPARALMVGVIGLWQKGEPAHEPGDRALIQTPKSPLGSAYIRLNGPTLALDLSNSVPEVDKNLTKLDVGVLTIVAVDPASNKSTPVGSVPYSQYDRSSYEASAGIVTVTINPNAGDLSNQDLHIQVGSGQRALVEMPLRGIPASPNLYLDDGDQANPAFQVYDRGVPATTSVSLNLYQMDAAGDQPTSVTPVNTDSNGVLTVPITAGPGSITAYVPSFNTDDEPANGINPLVNTYMYVRVRPADSAIAQLPPTWENVYVKVLANWNAMAPCMDNWLKLDDPFQVKAYSAILKRLTDPANFENFRFMPVTRDMSVGERTLLYNFLDSGVILAVPKADAPEHTFARRSRSMRRI